MLMLALAIIGGFLISLAASYFLTPVVKVLAIERRWVDDPADQRKLHTTPIPRTGGLAIVAGFLVGLTFFALGPILFSKEVTSVVRLPAPQIILGALFMAGIGFLDDVKGLPSA
jgi:UDP-GlcNAc:undecaprenyl-phosphate GlcNAc-1-phosphate transferase